VRRLLILTLLWVAMQLVLPLGGCGAGAYPCGSIAGTPGYMCAEQISRMSQPGSV
jgi:hypothetical protein